MISGTKRGATIKDIAKEAGASVAVVSLVLNGKQKQYRISDEMTQRVRDAAERLNYKPNSIARSLRDGVSHTIGVIVSDISNQFSADIVRSIETAADNHGYTAIFSSSDENSDKLSTIASKMMSKDVDGMIVVPCEGSDHTIRELVGMNMPLVLLDRYIPELQTAYVCLDNKAAAFEATMHLLDNGFRKVSMVSYDSEMTNMAGRREGYVKAMEESGMKDMTDIRYVSMNNLEADCIQAMTGIRERGSDAVLFSTNTIASFCLTHIIKNGIRIPDDLGIVTFDGSDGFDYFYSPLTSVRQPIEKMAHKSVEMLIDIIRNPGSPSLQIEAEGKLEIKASSNKK